MKVVIASSFDIHGGPAKAAHRLHHALLGIDVDSRMLVQVKTSDDVTVIGSKSYIPRSLKKCRHPLDQIPVWKYKDSNTFSPAWLPLSNIVHKINSMNPDVVHLHWVARGMLSIEDLARIRAPIVWSLHDMWPFTGGCHYDEECGAYKNKCGRCKVLRSDDDNDLSRKVYLRKHKTLSSVKHLVIVGLSRWLANCASQSSLFKERKVVNLPNPIDTGIYSPMDRHAARDRFKLPKSKKLVLYGAVDATSDPRKGFSELKTALSAVKRTDVELVVFGSDGENDHSPCSIKTHFIGKLSDDASLTMLYNAADVMVAPSKQENLSNTIMEALSCGTPVVAFDIGGNSDMIEHESNGYLAKPFDADDFKNGIEWVLDPDSHTALSKAARNKVLENYEAGHVARQYLSLYEELAAQAADER